MFFIFLIVVAAFLAVLKVLSLLVDAIQGRRRPQRPAKIGAWSGIVTALIVTETMFAGLLAIGLLGSVRVQSMAHAAPLYPQEQSELVETVEEQRTQRLAEAVEDVQGETAEVTKINDDAVLPAMATDKVVHSPEEQTAFIEARKAEMQQLVIRIGQFVSANLDLVSDQQGATVFGQAAKSENGDVVVFQPSDEMVKQILGAAGQDLLRSFNSELPERIRQTYALIPLTPPVGSTVPVKPLLAAGGLEKIANSIVLLVERAESATPAAAVDNSALPAEADGDLVVKPEIRPIPDWVSRTDGRRIVTQTRPILPGDDSDALLTIAVNEALSTHVKSITATMNPDLHQQARFVRMELPQAAAMKCVVDTYERLETMETQTEGATPFRIRYALLEFPEAVDQIAVRSIRQSIQQDRIRGLGVVVGFVWLSVVSSGFGIWQWRKGTRLRRVTAIPVFVVVAIPTLLIAAGVVFALSKGEVVGHQWNSQAVTIDLETM